MTHLGDRITSLVDGQLAPAEAERANAHLASCPACREAAELERLTKHRLRSLPDVAPGPGLVDALLRMGGPDGPLPPRADHVPGTPRPQTLPVPAGPAGSSRPGGRSLSARRAPAGHPGRRPARRTRRVAVAVVGGLCAVGAVAVALAGVPATTGGVVPPVTSFVVDHSGTTSTLPFGDQLASWRTGGEEDK